MQVWSGSKKMADERWTAENMATFVALHDLKNVDRSGIDRLTEVANKVLRTGAAIPRMPSKSDEPAPTFRVGNGRQKSG